MASGSERRDVILQAAARLFAEKGVTASTVREIAESVGILSGSLYHHFDSKASMVEAIIISYLDDLRQRYAAVVAADSEPRECLAALVRESFATIEAHPYATEIYQNDQAYLRSLPRSAYLRAAAAEVQQTWLTVITSGVASGDFRDDIAPQVFYRFMRDAVWLSVRWFTPTRSYPMSKLAEECTAVFLDGFATRGPDGGPDGGPHDGSARNSGPAPRARKATAGARPG
jgi:TetR/AcrR family transcriptional regulator, cholesterol catabolism regulator